MKLDDVCDYIITKLCEESNASLSVLKLQKLMYYVQAWHLALYGKPLFNGKFQAWIHGPVNRALYVRFMASKLLYSDVKWEDRKPEFDLDTLDPEDKEHIDNVLEVYAKFTGTQLEELTHREEPWQKAREGVAPNERCEQEIDENLMATFYAKLMDSEPAF